MNILLIILLACVFIALIILIKRNQQKPHSGNDTDNSELASKMISDLQAREFISDVTSKDVETLSAFDGGIKNPKSISFEIENEFRSFGHIAHAMHVTKRIKEIDWAAGTSFVFDQFSALLELDGIKISDDVWSRLNKSEHEIKRGDAPEVIATLLRETANNSGYEILNLNAGDDQYRFLIAPSQAAKKWENAFLGKHIKVEIPLYILPPNFTNAKVKKPRREPRSKLVRHLQRETEQSARDEDSLQLFLEKKETLLRALNESDYRESDTDEFWQAMGGHSFAIAMFDIVAKSLGDNYFVNDFDFKAYALGLYYKMLAPRVQNFGQNRISIISVPTYVMFGLIGQLSQQKLWTAYSAPKIRDILDSEDDQMKKIAAQFPLMPLLLEDDNLAEKAHDLLSKAYDIDTRKDLDLLYDKMIEDRIQYSRLLPDLYISIYTNPPFSFIPLEILFVSKLIDLPLSQDLVFLRDKLSELSVETDEGIIALEKYLAQTGK